MTSSSVDFSAKRRVVSGDNKFYSFEAVFEIFMGILFSLSLKIDFSCDFVWFRQATMLKVQTEFSVS